MREIQKSSHGNRNIQHIFLGLMIALTWSSSAFAQIEVGRKFVELAKEVGKTPARLEILWCEYQPEVRPQIVVHVIRGNAKTKNLSLSLNIICIS